MEGFTSLLRGKLLLKPSENKVRILRVVWPLPKPHRLLRADLAKPDKRYGESSTSKLPPEILGVIFDQLDRNSTDLVRVTSVCSRWRTIAVQTPYLWTNIEVHVNSLNKKKTRKVLSRVSLFLGRAGDLPLDVVWHAYGNRNSVPQFYNLFREKGPFIRWKTLSLNLNADLTHPLGEFRQSDSFSNLVWLTLVSQPPLIYLDCLNKTISKDLETFELGQYFQCSHDFHTEYAGILHAITTLCLWGTVTLPAVPFPPNVTTLRAVTLPNIAMPHIRHVHLITLCFLQPSAFDLTNLVLLEVALGVDGSPTDVSIDLPSLLSFILSEESFSALPALNAPSLQNLTINCPHLPIQTVDGPFIQALRNGFRVSKLLVLFLGIYLDGPATLEVLRFFPDITRLDLSYYDQTHAEEVLWHVFPKDRRNFNICPSINTVSLGLDVPPYDKDMWRLLFRLCVFTFVANEPWVKYVEERLPQCPT